MKRFWFVACALATIVACTSAARETAADIDRAASEVRMRLAGYASASASVDAERSSAFFSQSGTLFEPGIPPIVGADSIRAFVASFPGVKVDSAMLRADTVEVFGRTALVWGTYYERLSFPGQPQSSQHGRFVMEWKRGTDDSWLIERYYRIPLPAGWRDR
jgi:ketosteroid isomerase-like protein